VANPKDTRSFDIWITDRVSFSIVTPESSTTGNFERPITDRINWWQYVKAAVETADMFRIY